MAAGITEFFASPDWVAALLWLAAAALIVAGLVGTVVPGIPGHPLIFAGALAGAWAGDFERIGWITLVILGIVTAIGMGIDWAAQALGAKKAGASKYGIAGALAGTVIGLFFGFIGIFFMPLAGAFAGELIAARGMKAAGSVGIATWLGMLAGAALKAAFGCVMLGILLLALWL